jgi:hypothetical protein
MSEEKISKQITEIILPLKTIRNKNEVFNTQYSIVTKSKSY